MDRQEYEKSLSYFLNNQFSKIDEDAFKAYVASSDETWEGFFETVELHEAIKTNKDRILSTSPEIRTEIEELSPLIDRAVNKLMIEAQKFLVNGNSLEGYRCIKELLKLKPGDEETVQKVFTILENEHTPHVADQYKEIPAFIIANLKGSSSESFSCKTSDLGGLRSDYDVVATEEEGPQIAKYSPGELINISISIPEKKEGHLILFHLDEENNLNMIFPNNPSDDTFVKGKDEKRVGITVTGPLGKHYIKAILTPNMIIKPQETNFDDDNKVARTIARLLKHINTLNKTEWLEAVEEIEIV